MDSLPCFEISDQAVQSINPLVSVMMLTYNHEQYISQAIEGVLQQKTDFFFELVIGEDCSTDRTREIIMEYQKKYFSIIRILMSDKNVGMHNNTRRTIKSCRGKYIAFCEGDDFWHHKNKLQIQVDFLENNPDYGLVHSEITHHNIEINEKIYSYYKNKLIPHDSENILRNIIELKYSVATCTAVVRTELCHEIYDSCHYEFSENFLMGDTQLWIEIAYRSKVKYFKEPLATYHALLESACHSKSIEKNLIFELNSKAMYMHYANKYGYNDYIDIKKQLAEYYNYNLIILACITRKLKLISEIIEESNQYCVQLGPIGFICSLGIKNIYVFYLTRFIVFAIWKCQHSLVRVKWLRTLKNIFGILRLKLNNS